MEENDPLKLFVPYVRNVCRLTWGVHLLSGLVEKGVKFQDVKSVLKEIYREMPILY